MAKGAKKVPRSTQKAWRHAGFVGPNETADEKRAVRLGQAEKQGSFRCKTLGRAFASRGKACLWVGIPNLYKILVTICDTSDVLLQPGPAVPSFLTLTR